eukprot:scaffold3187_cov361-Prasinococcus_capsulatus_cf.AAC.9
MRHAYGGLDRWVWASALRIRRLFLSGIGALLKGHWLAGFLITSFGVLMSTPMPRILLPPAPSLAVVAAWAAIAVCMVGRLMRLWAQACSISCGRRGPATGNSPALGWGWTARRRGWITTSSNRHAPYACLTPCMERRQGP